MDFSYFVGKKLATDSGKSFTRLIIRLAIAAVGISLAVMLLAVGVVKGFQSEIKNKIVGFDGHIHVRNLDLNQSRELRLIPLDQEFIPIVKAHPEVTSVAPFCLKAGIINTQKEIEGMVFKGVGVEYDWSFIASNLQRGRLPLLSDTVDTYEFVLSQKVAEKLQIDTGQNLEVFFIQDTKVRRRRMRLVGIFSTGLGEFDKTICFTDLRVIQRIYTTDYSQVSGFEINIKDLTQMEAMTDWVDDQIGIKLRAENIEEKHGVIFKWLQIVDSNALIIIILMTIVSVVNLITAFLILIVDRTQMIGILKSLGANNGQVVRVFLLKGLSMVIPGLIIGNALGLGLAWLQLKTGLITLPEETYYMATVPVQISWETIAYLNVGTLVISMLMMLIPAVMVRVISPVKAIRFN
ncbi:MAG: ABC transporter permease [Bacteroidetes bacterium]|jgi:lipoprotein-releasing system permease protein|nr:ABC transporter permease [Bacteroidota bacterium]